jgi:hypothetical protein
MFKETGRGWHGCYRCAQIEYYGIGVWAILYSSTGFQAMLQPLKPPPVHLDGPAIVFLATGGYNGKGKMIKWETDNGRFIEPYYF